MKRRLPTPLLPTYARNGNIVSSFFVGMQGHMGAFNMLIAAVVRRLSRNSSGESQLYETKIVNSQFQRSSLRLDLLIPPSLFCLTVWHCNVVQEIS